MLLNHIQKGSGQPIVLLHGFCENLHIWDPVIDSLAESAHVIAIDLPGSGANAPLSDPISIEDMATQVYKTVHELGVVSGILVGHSMGGYVSLALAEKNPQWMHGLCLFHSTAFADSAEKKVKRDKSAQFIYQHGIEEFNNSLVPTLFAASQRDILRDTIEEVKALTNQTPVSTAVQAVLAMKNRPDRTNVLRQSNYPVMFIAGREDEVVPLKDVQQQCWLPQGIVSAHTLPKVGHMGMWEKPELALAMMKNMVDIVNNI
uniref:Alpha/beta fold hydrolase n=1 Tax=Roseihalotalea indica TaxID=2867963 RepID=A0AA49GRG3_9BACT|nr:alpha/beta fold hydrolase [Tunicatimonas sp. TK19036]